MAEVPGLIALGHKYAEDGLQLLFFPCNQFCDEEPGSASDIAEFYVDQHGLPASWLMARGNVNGADTQQAFTFFKSELPGDVEWNFNKFVVGRNGQCLARFAQKVKPPQLEEKLKKWLGK